MAKDSSFDVVSQVDMQEMDNAVNQTKKEIAQRLWFPRQWCQHRIRRKMYQIGSWRRIQAERYHRYARARMAKRDIPLRCLELGKVEPASKGTVRQTLTILQGIPKEKAKAIVAAIKATKLKVNAQMQDDQVRVSGAKKDDLQAVIQTLKAGDFGVDLQFINMR